MGSASPQIFIVLQRNPLLRRGSNTSPISTDPEASRGRRLDRTPGSCLPSVVLFPFFFFPRVTHKYSRAETPRGKTNRPTEANSEGTPLLERLQVFFIQRQRRHDSFAINFPSPDLISSNEASSSESYRSVSPRRTRRERRVGRVGSGKKSVSLNYPPVPIRKWSIKYYRSGLVEVGRVVSEGD